MSGRARGLTLIEILIVIGLLLALAAIAAPAVVQQLEARAFDVGGDVIRRHLQLARAYAQRNRQAVEVVYEVDTRRMIARPFDVERIDADAPTDAPPLATVWSIRELPGRAELSEQAPPDAPDAKRPPKPAGWPPDSASPHPGPARRGPNSAARRRRARCVWRSSSRTAPR